jgi:rhodanese-related sulfurtransferase
VRTSRLVAPGDLASDLSNGREPVLVDVRTPDEYEDVRIGDYANLPLTEPDAFGRVLDRASPVLFVCNSAYRSSMAIGLAERQGFKDLASLDGGLDAWLTQKRPTKGRAAVCGPDGCPAPAAASGSSTPWPLPEAIEPRALATALLDDPAAYDVVDVRPAWQFDEYHVPGATRVEPSGLLARVRALPAGKRVVVVDRDGTTAFAVAGALLATLADPARSVRALVGGTARFHRDVEQERGATPDRTPAAAPKATDEPTPATPAPAAPPKKRPAGC